MFGGVEASHRLSPPRNPCFAHLSRSQRWKNTLGSWVMKRPCQVSSEAALILLRCFKIVIVPKKAVCVQRHRDGARVMSRERFCGGFRFAGVPDMKKKTSTE